jgi:hypothetical protein
MWLGMAPWLVAVVALSGATLAAVVAARAGRQEPTDLLWDGQVWKAGGQRVGLELMMDLGSWKLIRLRPDQAGPVRWLALTSTDAGSALHALQVALYARPPGVRSKRLAAQGLLQNPAQNPAQIHAQTDARSPGPP